MRQIFQIFKTAILYRRDQRGGHHQWLGEETIYAQLIPLWDGEDDQFDLENVTEKELSQFSNLKTIDGTIFPFSKEVRDLFESKGIDIEE